MLGKPSSWCTRVWCFLVLLVFPLLLAPRAGADEFADLAALIATPLYRTHEAARAGKSDEAVLLRLEIARRGVSDIDKAKTDAEGTYARALVKLEECRLALDRIRQLNGDAPDIVGVVDKALGASPALIRQYQEEHTLPGDQDAVNELIAKGVRELIKAGANQWQLAEEWSAYRSHYASFRDVALELASVAKRRPCLYGIGMSYTVTDDGANSKLVIDGLSPEGPASRAGIRLNDTITAVDDEPVVLTAKLNAVAIRRLEPAAKGATVKLRIARGASTLDFNVDRQIRLDEVPDLVSLSLCGSCDGAFASDELAITNTSGMDLTNCTLLVTLTSGGSDEGELEELHFVRLWPKNQKLVASYANAGSKRIASNESFRMVKNVNVQLYADQFQGTNFYSYWDSDERRADLKRYCENYCDISAKLLPETDGFLAAGDGLYHTDAAVRVWLGQRPDKSPPKLTPRQVTIRLVKGNKSVTEAWEGAECQGGTLPFKTFSSAKLNGLVKPDSLEIRLSFFGTDYEHVIHFSK